MKNLFILIGAFTFVGNLNAQELRGFKEKAEVKVAKVIDGKGYTDDEKIQINFNCDNSSLTISKRRVDAAPGVAVGTVEAGKRKALYENGKWYNFQSMQKCVFTKGLLNKKPFEEFFIKTYNDPSDARGPAVMAVESKSAHDDRVSKAKRKALFGEVEDSTSGESATKGD